MSWQRSLVERLVAGAHRNGAWGYQPETPACAEPTAMVALALAAQGVKPDLWTNGLAWLAKVQHPDGGVPVSADVVAPCWATSLAVLAWAANPPSPPLRGGGRGGGDRHELNIERAVAWLLATRGRRVAFNPALYGHDSRLEGWPWVDGTHSWLEPTAYSILALKSADNSDHPRAREGVKLLLDRVHPGGGWNYGNTRVLASSLRPFPSTTGIVLTAVAGEPTDQRIDASIAYLTKELQTIRSPLSLGWGLIGLAAWDARPGEGQSWLAQCASRTSAQRPNALEDAVLLLADVEPCPLIRLPVGDMYGHD